MPQRLEIEAGTELLKQRLQVHGLKIARVHRFSDRMASYFEFTSGAAPKRVSTVLTDEFLSDLPETSSLQNSLEKYLGAATCRLMNPSPLLFYCASGMPVEIEIEWPIQWVPNRAASFVWVTIRDIRLETVAKCSALMTHQLEIMDADFRSDPFLREEMIVNSCRRAIDSGEIVFFVESELPSELPSVRVTPDSNLQSTPFLELQEFLAAKVYWLAFRKESRNSKAWLYDPWDSSYLGVSVQQMRQAADILSAKSLVSIDHLGCASARDGLLRESDSFEKSNYRFRKKSPELF